MNQDDEQMRALLSEVGEQPGPPLGFSADGIARRSRRIKLARWGAGVAGSLTVTAVIALSVFLATNRPAPPATPPPITITTTDFPTTTTTPVPTTTESTTDS
jgi:hypothetical protein